MRALLLVSGQRATFSSDRGRSDIMQLPILPLYDYIHRLERALVFKCDDRVADLLVSMSNHHLPPCSM